MPAEQRKTERRPDLRLAATVLTLSLCAPAATKYEVLHNFPYPDNGVGAVTVDKQGNVYGATASGGTGKGCGEYRCGFVFELTPQPDGKWTFAVIHDFGGRDGAGMNSPLILDVSGNLYGTTQSGGRRGGGTAFELTPGAGGWSETVLYSFCNQQGCVGLPQSGVAMDSFGNLYGTTPEEPYGGAIYHLAKVSGHWKEATLHRFCANGPPCNDGSGPYAGLMLDAAGNLYGTTSYGGTGCGGDGCGTVYELSLDPNGKWKETILHHFDNNGKDGLRPGSGTLIMDGSGQLYGTTDSGGPDWCGEVTCGTVFKLTPNGNGGWKETILYDFIGGADGYWPDGGVVMDKSGNLYGTAGLGGNGSGCGGIYKLAPRPGGKRKYSVLHTFGNGYDGCLPLGNLAIDGNGNLYGGTVFGGTHGNGVVFELTP